MLLCFGIVLQFIFHWALCLVGMCCASIHFEAAVHSAAEFVFRKHALHRQLDRATWIALHQGCHGQAALSAGVTRVPDMALGGPFLACEADLVGVDHDDVVATVHVWAVARLVLAAQDQGDLAAEAAEDLAFGIDHEPILLDSLGRRVLRLITERIHLNTSNSV
jgi:hypothetical protein